ncbi:MAG: lipoate--protein ligase family protein [Thermodesulfovibrionales bacterium]|nr:lipoate--protein ligase family protein [Thermodesulfovibrionales bacterium]
MTRWRLIESGKCDAFFNMALDEAISISVKEGKSPSTLRFFSWITPSVTIGCFQSLEKINTEFCKHNKIPIVRRPTGGRAIFHFDEITYSFSATTDPPFNGGLFQTYFTLSKVFSIAFSKLGLDIKIDVTKKTAPTKKYTLCFYTKSFGELTFQGKKIIGSAQRRWRNAFIQQGTIPLIFDHTNTKNIFLDYDDNMNYYIGLKEISIKGSHSDIKENIIKTFESYFNISFFLSSPSGFEFDLAEKLIEEKYCSLV